VDVATLTDLLRKTSEWHGSLDAVAPPHDWRDWYAAYTYPPGRQQFGRCRRSGWTLHGRGQARRCDLTGSALFGTASRTARATATAHAPNYFSIPACPE
jgi:hypothetical protein